MKIKRYYRKQPIEVGRIRAIRDILVSSHKWNISSNQFILYYPAEDFTITDIEELEEAAKIRDKKPTCISAFFTTEQGSFLELATCEPEVITIEVETVDSNPDLILEDIEPVLSLTPITPEREIKSAFLAHPFDDEASQYANEVARFLGLIDISSQSGRGFSPDSVSEKVQERLAKHDFFIAIITRQEDPTWLIQEITAAKYLKKPIFILKQEEVTLKLGLLGDYEFIPFPKGQISRTFIPILEGLHELHKR